MIEVYYLNVGVMTAANYDKICENLCAERRQKAQNYLSERDRFLSAGASYLLNCALKNRGVCDGLENMSFGKYGKPYIKDCGLHFNLSHSGDLAVVAVSDCEVGVDVEKLIVKGDAIIKKICTDSEREYLNSLDGKDRNKVLTRMWTAKESYIKFTGLGLSLSPSKLNVRFNGGIKIERENTVCNGIFSEFEIENYSLTVCSGKFACASFPTEITL